MEPERDWRLSKASMRYSGDFTGSFWAVHLSVSCCFTITLLYPTSFLALPCIRVSSQSYSHDHSRSSINHIHCVDKSYAGTMTDRTDLKGRDTLRNLEFILGTKKHTIDGSLLGRMR